MVSKGNLIRRWDGEYHNFKEETKKSMEEWRLYECIVMYEIINWAISTELDQELIDWLWHDDIMLDRIVDWFIDSEYPSIQSRIADVVAEKFRRFGIDKASKV